MLNGLFRFGSILLETRTKSPEFVRLAADLTVFNVALEDEEPARVSGPGGLAAKGLADHYLIARELGCDGTCN